MRQATGNTAELEWVSCGACSTAVRTRAELIRHVESAHMCEPESVIIEDLMREEVRDAQRRLRKTSGSEGWTEHMFVDRRVLRCKGIIGRPYYQQIGGDQIKVQKLCPATCITGEPTFRGYKVSMFSKHIGHPSQAYAPELNPAKEVCDRLVALATTLTERAKQMAEEDLKQVLKKVAELESMLRAKQTKPVLPNDEQTSRKRKLEPAVQEAVVEKAVDEALEKYIKAVPKTEEPSRKRKTEPNVQEADVEKAVDEALGKYILSKSPHVKIEDIKMEADVPKIVNTFSLRSNGEPFSSNDDDIDAFVKDVELLVNNGKTYEATENRNKLGHVGEKIDKSSSNRGDVACSEEEINELNPVVKMEGWQNSSFNDTYKEFISRELASKVPDIRPKKIRSEAKAIRTYRSKHYKPRKSIPESKPDTPQDIVTPSKDEALTQDKLNSVNPDRNTKRSKRTGLAAESKTVKDIAISRIVQELEDIYDTTPDRNTKRAKQTTPVPQIKMTKKPVQDIPVSGKVPVLDTSDTATPRRYTKRAKPATPIPQSKTVKKSIEDVTLSGKAKQAIPDNFGTIINDANTKRVKSVPVKGSKIGKKPILDVSLSRKSKEPIADDFDTIINDANAKRAKSTPVTESKPRKRPIQDIVTRTVKEPKAVTVTDRNTKRTKLVPAVPDSKAVKNPTKSIKNVNIRRFSAPVQPTKKAVKELTQNLNNTVDSGKVNKRSRVSLDQKSQAKSKQEAVIKEVQIKRSKTGLKSKPTNKPKSKAASGKVRFSLADVSQNVSPVKISTEKEEFIVQEQENDVNILIIRM